MASTAPRSSMTGFPDTSLTVARPPLEARGLAGKHFVVVGGTDGLGRALTHLALEKGARVTVVGRTLRDAPRPGLDFVPADLSSMKAAARLGETLPVDGVDGVLLTLGTIAAPRREVTAEGLAW